MSVRAESDCGSGGVWWTPGDAVDEFVPLLACRGLDWSWTC